MARDDHPAIYIELIPAGNAVEVAAIDSETGHEVRFMAPKDTSEIEIKKLAAAKIAYVIRKAAKAKASTQPPKSTKGGIVV